MMTQQERLDYLLEQMKNDLAEYRYLELPESYDERRKDFRAFMNIRMPKKYQIILFIQLDQLWKQN